jgi:hypothetical protein
MKDVFKAYLVEGANFTDGEEFPIIKSCNQIPDRLIPFSKTKDTKYFNQAVHFYEPDYNIMCFSHNPFRYLPRLRKFATVITCDYSIYRDMPLVLQKSQTYLNRSLGFWLQKNGIPIIPNVRYGDERTYSFCFEGIPENSVISIGTHGSMRREEDIYFHIKGISETIRRLKPQAILIYGTITKDIEYILKSNNVIYYVYKSYTSTIFDNKSYPSNFLFDTLEKGGA